MCRRPFQKLCLTLVSLFRVLASSKDDHSPGMDRNASKANSEEVVGGWHTTSRVRAVLEQANQSRSITVTCDASTCDPPGALEDRAISEDGTGLDGIFLLDIELPISSHVVFTVVGVAMPADEEAVLSGPVRRLFVCPLVTAFTPNVTGFRWTPLVGKCQASLPSSLSPGALPLSASSFFTFPTNATRYKVGIYFGGNSIRGDQFLVRHIELVEPPSLAPVLQVKAGDVNAGYSIDVSSANTETRIQCPSHLPAPTGREMRAMKERFERQGQQLLADDSTRQALPFLDTQQLPEQNLDALVSRHIGPLQYRNGEQVFEAGCGSGAVLSSVARQFQVRVTGVDFAPSMVGAARKRVKGSFCAADARNLSFIPAGRFDHTLSVGLFTLLDSSQHACAVASELLRITKQDGTIYLGFLNDPDLAPYRGTRVQGGVGVAADFWYKFAIERGVSVRVLRGEEIDARGHHAHYRYHVYMRKKKPPSAAQPLLGGDVDCGLLRSLLSRRRFTVTGSPCTLPFQFEGVWFDDCTDVAIGTQREEFCCLTAHCDRQSGWERCAAVYPGGSLGSDSGAGV